ncbi:RecX family transcriptional regulator [Actinomadura macrotermitis]|uniref:Regulatory protein RecX n=1 Tax=Actinomadura macrotermitis TaxID=2585200 RepID=A0A7K0BNM4_9ACTN|nr:RecX family transcriptional regulator [Actinomadura macrotermitis]MQY02788.1 Regulatory protein RecX [Actinomadura macrotermitis]
MSDDPKPPPWASDHNPWTDAPKPPAPAEEEPAEWTPASTGPFADLGKQSPTPRWPTPETAGTNPWTDQPALPAEPQEEHPPPKPRRTAKPPKLGQTTQPTAPSPKTAAADTGAYAPDAADASSGTEASAGIAQSEPRSTPTAVESDTETTQTAATDDAEVTEKPPRRRTARTAKPAEDSQAGGAEDLLLKAAEADVGTHATGAADASNTAPTADGTPSEPHSTPATGEASAETAQAAATDDAEVTEKPSRRRVTRTAKPTKDGQATQSGAPFPKAAEAAAKTHAPGAADASSDTGPAVDGAPSAPCSAPALGEAGVENVQGAVAGDAVGNAKPSRRRAGKRIEDGQRSEPDASLREATAADASESGREAAARTAGAGDEEKRRTVTPFGEEAHDSAVASEGAEGELQRPAAVFEAAEQGDGPGTSGVVDVDARGNEGEVGAWSVPAASGDAEGVEKPARRRAAPAEDESFGARDAGEAGSASGDAERPRRRGQGFGGRRKGRGSGEWESGGPFGRGSGERRAEKAPADPEAKAREICLRMLTGSPRTRAQLADALRRKEIPDDVAERVLGRFTDVGLIDDEAFAQMWVQSRHAGRGLAKRALAAELRQRGVDNEIVKEAVHTLDADQEEQTARALIERKLRSTQGLDPAKRTRRLVGVLARKGYSAGLSYRVVKEALAEEGQEAAEGDWE